MSRFPTADGPASLSRTPFSPWKRPSVPADLAGQARPELHGLRAHPNSDRGFSNLRIGIISNRKAHRNLDRVAEAPACVSPVVWSAPLTHEELSTALAGFAARGVNALIIDGGDGTVRDVITAALPHFPDKFPTIAIIPSGKTNALALDLGVSPDWTVAAALISMGIGNVRQRTPIEIWRSGSPAPDLCGFLFGAGAFVRATRHAQRVHSLGAFDGLAVGLSLISAITQTFFGGRRNRWRQGENMRVGFTIGDASEQRYYIALASTLNRLPLGIRPFGRRRDGLKVLGIDAPPRRMLMSVPALLAGSEASWLDHAGYHRSTTETLHLSVENGFILDGEFYSGGDLILKKGAALDFAVP